RLRAGRGKALEVRRVEHAPPRPCRAHAIVAATGVDQDLLAADLEQPAVHAQLDLAARRLVVVRCGPVFILARDIVGEFRKDFLRVVDREIGFLDAGYGCVADRILEHAFSLAAPDAVYFGRNALVKVDGKSIGAGPSGCRYAKVARACS